MRGQVEKAQLLAGPPQEPVFHEEEEDVPVEAEELVQDRIGTRIGTFQSSQCFVLLKGLLQAEKVNKKFNLICLCVSGMKNKINVKIFILIA